MKVKVIDTNIWKRSQHFKHFNALKDPYFAVTIPFNVKKAYRFSKDNGVSFFIKYLHDCMKAINAVENLKYRIVDNDVVLYDVIHASPTIMRADNTYGFSFIEFDERLEVFNHNFQSEKQRIQNSNELFPTRNGLDCIHCSAMPWFNFVGHKEPISGEIDSVPKLAFGKMENDHINVAIHVNHALVDGYHVALFVEKFQFYLNN